MQAQFWYYRVELKITQKNILIYVNVNYHTAGVQWFNSILQEEYNIL